MQPFKPTILIALILSTGCVSETSKPPTAPTQSPFVSVDGGIAKLQNPNNQKNYTGTTEPIQEVSVRSQVEGKLLTINVDVGDQVKQGQSLATIDDSLLEAMVNQMQAELASAEAQLYQAKTQVRDYQSRLEQVRAQLQQAQVDAKRLQNLASQGALASQQAELAQTNLITTQQQLRSASEQVNSQKQAVIAAEARVKSQKAILSQALKRQSYSLLLSPINGVVLKRPSEPGNLIQPGEEVLSLGDFSQIKVVVQLSELSLNNITLGQQVQVRLDAFPEANLTGKISRISPVADRVSRLLPIEIVIPNDGRLAGGLLARVSFSENTQPRVIIPESAVKDDTVFVIQKSDTSWQVTPRTIKVGDRRDGQIEVISGLNPGEQFVINSSRPLKSGDLVRLSIISEK